MSLPKTNVYEPLGKFEIRLLRFEVRDGDGGAIRCSLEVHNLRGEYSPFQALSYAWGSATYTTTPGNVEPQLMMSESILCNDTRISVSRNTFDACSQLQADDPPDTRYWIDAICINQEDMNERAQQVRIMDEVYSAAEEVIIWLGPRHPLLDNFIYVTDTLIYKLDALAIETDGKKLLGHGMHSSELARALGEASLTDRIYQFCKFCSSFRWFARAWVLQEFVFARKVRLKCGDRELSWSRATVFCHFLRGVGWESYVEYHARFEHKDNNLNYDGTCFTRKDDLRDLDSKHHGIMPRDLDEGLKALFGAKDRETYAIALAAYFVFAVQTFQSTDPRDKVFSAIGLVKRYFAEGIDEYFTVDYHSSVRMIYQRFTEMLVLKLPLLNILSYIGDTSSRNLEDLPSWVADYSSDPVIGLYSFLGKGRMLQPLMIPAMPSTARRVEESVLYCYGASVDVVTQVCRSIGKKIGNSPALEDLCEIGSYFPATFRGQDRVECLWRTLIADTVDDLCPAPDSFATNFTAAMTNIGSMELDASLYGRTIDLQEMAKVVQRLDPDGTSTVFPNLNVLQSHCESLKKACFSKDPTVVEVESVKMQAIDDLAIPYMAETERSSMKRLFVTEKGFFGFGPASTRPGDEVFFLHAASVPFVFRPKTGSDNMQLVGECYLHGFMHGEILDDEFGWVERVREFGIA